MHEFISAERNLAMLIVAFICFISLIVGWLVAPTSAPLQSAESTGSAAVSEPGTVPA